MTYGNKPMTRKQLAAMQTAQAEEADGVERRNPSLLERADAIINGDRQRDYGDKLQNFSQIAMLWQGTLATKLAPDVAITPEDVALCMIQVKIARLAKTPDHEDSILDVAGYAGCYSLLQKERSEGKELLGATIDPRGPQF
jgi:hypothetical protein